MGTNINNIKNLYALELDNKNLLTKLEFILFFYYRINGNGKRGGINLIDLIGIEEETPQTHVTYLRIKERAEKELEKLDNEEAKYVEETVKKLMKKNVSYFVEELLLGIKDIFNPREEYNKYKETISKYEKEIKGLDKRVKELKKRFTEKGYWFDPPLASINFGLEKEIIKRIEKYQEWKEKSLKEGIIEEELTESIQEIEFLTLLYCKIYPEKSSRILKRIYQSKLPLVTPINRLVYEEKIFNMNKKEATKKIIETIFKKKQQHYIQLKFPFAE